MYNKKYRSNLNAFDNRVSLLTLDSSLALTRPTYHLADTQLFVTKALARSLAKHVSEVLVSQIL
jgi:hypothetical protein